MTVIDVTTVSTGADDEVYEPVHDSSWALAPEGTDPRIIAWVEKMAHLTTPDTVVWCDGSRRDRTNCCAASSPPAPSRG